ncbi:hypothetical protein [Streptomyces sp. NPDC027717]
MPGPALLVMDVQRAVTERVPDPDYTPRLARAAEVTTVDAWISGLRR